METYKNRKIGCDGYVSDNYTEFTVVDLKPGEKPMPVNRESNNLIVVFAGKLLVGYNEYPDVEVGKDEMVFIPAYAASRAIAISASKIIMSAFELPSDVHKSRMMQSLWELRMNTKFTFMPIPVKPVMKQYLDLLMQYLVDGLQCPMLHEAKEDELYLIFMHYYSDQEFVRLFHPIVVKSLDFRAVVMKNYTKMRSITELAEVAGMSRSKFDLEFRKVFGMSAKHWIQERRAANIKYYMTKPGISIKDIMLKYDFLSFSEFNRFSNRYFGMSPSEFLKIQQAAVDHR